jgi:hypothetical protein
MGPMGPGLPMQGPMPFPPQGMSGPGLPWTGPPQAPMYSPHPPRRAGLQPWMLVVGALVMALLAFAVTRAFIG